MESSQTPRKASKSHSRDYSQKREKVTNKENQDEMEMDDKKAVYFQASHIPDPRRTSQKMFSPSPDARLMSKTEDQESQSRKSVAKKIPLAESTALQNQNTESQDEGKLETIRKPRLSNRFFPTFGTFPTELARAFSGNDTFDSNQASSNSLKNPTFLDEEDQIVHENAPNSFENPIILDEDDQILKKEEDEEGKIQFSKEEEYTKILLGKDGVYYIELDQIYTILYPTDEKFYPSQKLADHLRKKDFISAIKCAMADDDSKKNNDLVVIENKNSNILLKQDDVMQWINPRPGYRTKVARRKTGESFVTLKAWDELVVHESFNDNKTIKKAKTYGEISKFDTYIQRIVREHQDPTKRASIQILPHKKKESEKRGSLASKNAFQRGIFAFASPIEKPLNIVAPEMKFHPQTDEWFAFANSLFGVELCLWHGLMTSNYECGNKQVAYQFVCLLTYYCQQFLHDLLKEEFQTSYPTFCGFGEDQQLGKHSRPDYALSLLHSTVVGRMPLVLIEEKLDLTKIQDSPQQFAKYCRDMFDKYVEVDDRKIYLKRAYLLGFAQKSKHVKLIRWDKDENSVNFAKDCNYTGEFAFFEDGGDGNGSQLQAHKYRTLMKSLIGCVYDQLKSLNLVKPLPQDWK